MASNVLDAQLRLLLGKNRKYPLYDCFGQSYTDSARDRGNYECISLDAIWNNHLSMGKLSVRWVPCAKFEGIFSGLHSQSNRVFATFHNLGKIWIHHSTQEKAQVGLLPDKVMRK